MKRLLHSNLGMEIIVFIIYLRSELQAKFIGENKMIYQVIITKVFLFDEIRFMLLRAQQNQWHNF